MRAPQGPTPASHHRPPRAHVGLEAQKPLSQKSGTPLDNLCEDMGVIRHASLPKQVGREHN